VEVHARRLGHHVLAVIAKKLIPRGRAAADRDIVVIGADAAGPRSRAGAAVIRRVAGIAAGARVVVVIGIIVGVAVIRRALAGAAHRVDIIGPLAAQIVGVRRGEALAGGVLAGVVVGVAVIVVAGLRLIGVEIVEVHARRLGHHVLAVIAKK